MSIILIEQPGSTPSDLTDWTKSVETHKYYNLGNNDPVDYDFSGNTVKKGVLINIGGSNYQTISNEAITGTPSDYVKITPSGSTASASYVANLTGVSWNDAYNFYADISGNAYIFNEAEQVANGIITTPKTVIGKFAEHGYFKTLTSTGSIILDNGTSDSPNVVFISSGFNTLSMDNAGGSLRFLNDNLGQVFGAFGTTGNLLLGTNPVDDTINRLQAYGSIYSSTYINAENYLLVGLSGGLGSALYPGSLEIGQNRTSDGFSFIDITSTVGADFNIRISRAGGVDGIGEIAQTGTGRFDLVSVDNAVIGIRGSADYATFSNSAITLNKNTSVYGNLTLEEPGNPDSPNLRLVSSGFDTLYLDNASGNFRFINENLGQVFGAFGTTGNFLLGTNPVDGTVHRLQVYGSIFTSTEMTASHTPVQTTLPGLIDAPYKVTEDPNMVSGSLSYSPYLYSTNQINGVGFRKHFSFGAYRGGSADYGGGFYMAQSDNDTSPSETFYIELGGTISHSSGIVNIGGILTTSTLKMNGPIDPTITPVESNIPTMGGSSSFETYDIPNGHYSVRFVFTINVLSASTKSGGLQRYINGSWRNVTNASFSFLTNAPIGSHIMTLEGILASTGASTSPGAVRFFTNAGSAGDVSLDATIQKT